MVRSYRGGLFCCSLERRECLTPVECGTWGHCHMDKAVTGVCVFGVNCKGVAYCQKPPNQCPVQQNAARSQEPWRAVLTLMGVEGLF